MFKIIPTEEMVLSHHSDNVTTLLCFSEVPTTCIWVGLLTTSPWATLGNLISSSNKHSHKLLIQQLENWCPFFYWGHCQTVTQWEDNALPSFSVLPESLLTVPSWYFHCTRKHIKRLSAEPLQGTSPECTFKFLPLILGLGSFCLFLKSLLVC